MVASQTVVTSQTVVAQVAGVPSVRHMGQGGGVVDEGGWGSKDLAESSNHGGLSLALPPLLRGRGGLSLGGLYKSEVGGLGGGNLGGVNRGDQRLGVEGRGDEGLGVEGGGDQGLGVEGRGNAVEHGSDGQTRVGHTETGRVGDVLHPLQGAVGVHVGISAGHTAVGVAHLVLGGVQVGVAVVQVAELVLGVELRPGGVGRGVGQGGDGGGLHRGGVGHRGVVCGVASVRQAGVSSIAVAGVSGVEERLSLVGQAGGQQERQDNLDRISYNTGDGPAELTAQRCMVWTGV